MAILGKEFAYGDVPLAGRHPVSRGAPPPFQLMVDRTVGGFRGHHADGVTVGAGRINSAPLTTVDACRSLIGGRNLLLTATLFLARCHVTLLTLNV
jgi:hypothetical protein